MNIELVSIHIPKTAGTSFSRVLGEVYGEEAVFPDNGDYTSVPLEAMPLEPHHRVIHGHVWAGRYKALLPRVRRVTWLRHPVDWVISLYGFLDTLGPNENPAWAYLKASRPSLLDFAASDGVHAQTPTRFLKNVDLGDFFFVGLQEHFADDLLELGTAMGWRAVVGPQINVNPGVLPLRSEVWGDRSIFDSICDRLEEDMMLYEAAVALRERRLAGSIATSSDPTTTKTWEEENDAIVD